MERPQARFRASKAFQTENNLARQPVSPDEVEANLLEMLDRPPLSDRSRKKASTAPTRSNRNDTASSRKPCTPVDRKLVASLRRLWKTNQQLFTQEVEQLEACVDRINQILAERTRQSSLEQLHSNALPETEQPAADPDPPLPSTPTSSRRAPELPQFTPIVEQASNRLPHGGNRSAPLEQQDTENLQAGIDQITHLLNEVNSWTAEKTSVEQNLSTPARLPLGGTAKQSPVQASASQPEPNSTARDATRTAEALRHLAQRERPALPKELLQSNSPAQRLTRLTPRRSRRRQRFRLNQLLRTPKTPISKVVDAVVWIGLAGVVGVGTQSLLTAVPTLSPFVRGLMVAPAAIAVYLTIFVPNAGFISVYRLFLVMVGLLLGGKL